MKIQNTEIDDSEIYDAGGCWKRDTHCVIVVILSDKRKPPLIFVSTSPEEANQMHRLMNEATDIARKNNSE